jgi:two-component SAPR family response regulator
MNNLKRSILPTFTYEVFKQLDFLNFKKVFLLSQMRYKFDALITLYITETIP